MKGDFTRDTFDLEKHFTRVLMQQGRVQVDADWNEQVSIFTEAIRSLAKDLIGPHGGPGPKPGFKILKDSSTGSGASPFTIGKGVYYVDGIRVENTTEKVGYYDQLDYRINPSRGQLPNGDCVVYLDVWERFVSFAEEPAIAEVALLGPDTCGRAQLVWQVKVLQIGAGGPATEGPQTVDLGEMLSRVIPKMKAVAAKPLASAEPCATSPDARYRGLENQLYRVEIHDVTGQSRDGGTLSNVTFKWSRENGSVVFPVKNISGDNVTLAHLGRDPRFGLKVGDWVELVDDDIVLLEMAQPLRKVMGVDPAKMEVTLDPLPPASTFQFDPKKSGLLRRWDQKESAAAKLNDGALNVEEGKPLAIEDGIEVTFTDRTATYRRGDYWLIPARTATGDIEWPRDLAGNASSAPPRGIIHHYAPLALGEFTGTAFTVEKDLRFAFELLAKAVT